MSTAADTSEDLFTAHNLYAQDRLGLLGDLHPQVSHVGQSSPRHQFLQGATEAPKYAGVTTEFNEMRNNSASFSAPYASGLTMSLCAALLCSRFDRRALLGLVPDRT